MEIDFADTKLRKRCEVEKEATRVWGKVGARKLFQRLAELEAAESLAVLLLLPAARCHALKGDRSGQFAVVSCIPGGSCSSRRKLVLTTWREGSSSPQG